MLIQGFPTHQHRGDADVLVTHAQTPPGNQLPTASCKLPVWSLWGAGAHPNCLQASGGVRPLIADKQP